MVCDSLTALLPPTFEGRPVEWDCDNSSVRRIAARLRELAKRRGVSVLLIHHSGKDVERGARGPSEWRNSVDMLYRLDAKPDGCVRVDVEKARDAGILRPFTLHLRHEAGTFGVELGDAVSLPKLSPSAEKADAFLRGAGQASAADIQRAAGIGSRHTMRTVAADCLSAGLWRDTGNKVGTSPIYAHTGLE